MKAWSAKSKFFCRGAENFYFFYEYIVQIVFFLYLCGQNVVFLNN